MADISMSIEVSQDPLIYPNSANHLVKKHPLPPANLNSNLVPVWRKRQGVFSKRFSNYLALFSRNRDHQFWKTLFIILRFVNNLKREVSEKTKVQKLKEYHYNFLEKNMRTFSYGETSYVRFLNINVKQS